MRIRAFRRYWVGNVLALLGFQMQFVAIGWDIYDRTGQTLQLGLVGLVQVIPVILLALPAGQVVDRFDRRKVIALSLMAILVSSLGLAAISWWRADYRWIYVALFVNGVARAFLLPAKSALVPLLVPRSRFANAVTWATSGFQLATIAGPAIGGYLIAVTDSVTAVYLMSMPLTLVFLLSVRTISMRATAVADGRLSLSSLLAGVSFVWRTKLVLGAITLDMFAVLLGGATALLPVYAQDILDVGANGLGWLRSAPGLGALVTSYILTHRPPIQNAGRSLLWSVVGFGAATLVFGLARNVWLAWAMLFLTGAFDMVSVVIRHTLIQLWTPDEMRGRVSAVNGMFIGISNELGEFESGTVSHFFERPHDVAFGPTVSVVSGGIGTILVTLAAVWLFPAMRRHGKLDETPHSSGS